MPLSLLKPELSTVIVWSLDKNQVFAGKMLKWVLFVNLTLIAQAEIIWYFDVENFIIVFKIYRGHSQREGGGLALAHVISPLPGVERPWSESDIYLGSDPDPGHLHPDPQPCLHTSKIVLNMRFIFKTLIKLIFCSRLFSGWYKIYPIFYTFFMNVACRCVFRNPLDFPLNTPLVACRCVFRNPLDFPLNTPLVACRCVFRNPLISPWIRPWLHAKHAISVHSVTNQKNMI